MILGHPLLGPSIAKYRVLLFVFTAHKTETSSSVSRCQL
jgi:hypothetical protein